MLICDKCEGKNDVRHALGTLETLERNVFRNVNQDGRSLAEPQLRGDLCLTCRGIVDGFLRHFLLDEPPDDVAGAETELRAKTIKDCDLSVRARKTLRYMDVLTVGDLFDANLGDLRAVKNTGPVTIAEIESFILKRRDHEI